MKWLLKKVVLTLSCVGFLLHIGCKENIADRPHGNQTPRTFLWIFPDSTVGVGVSRQHLRWWGEDPDGVVIGYLFAFAEFPNRVTTVLRRDTLRYTFETQNDTLIAFPLDTLFRNYTVFVRAVDNTFTGVPNHSIIRLNPVPSPDTSRYTFRPYWDKNDDGILDPDDQELPTLSGALDPVGAVQTFPIRNTPPAIVFAQHPNDPNLPLKQPDTTFTVATFAFKGSDFDGDNTLSLYRIVLNDTSDPTRWLTIALRDTIITLVVPRSRSDAAVGEVDADVYGGKFLGSRFLGQIAGLRLDALNVFYVQVKDVAGEFSQAIRMPSETGIWYVRKPLGRILLVRDYIRFDASVALTTYLTSLSGLPGQIGDTVDQLDIVRGITLNDKELGRFGTLVPPFVDPALIHTFLLYDCVFWYTDNIPSLGVAQSSLFTYLQNGGKVLFSTTFRSAFDPRGALRDFAPIDSVSSVEFSPEIPANYIVFADSSDPNNIYPQLALDSSLSSHFIFMRPVYRRTDARYIYHLQADTLNNFYSGTPNVAVVDGQGTIIFFGLPLHLLNNTNPQYANPEGLKAFFRKIFTEQFNSSHRVDRLKF